MGARQSTPSERLNKMVKDAFHEKKEDIKYQWKDPEGWERDEKRKREERSNRWWDMYQRDETKDPPPVGLGRIREAFEPIKSIEINKGDIIRSETEQGEVNRRSNGIGGAEVCAGGTCPPPELMPLTETADMN